MARAATRGALKYLPPAASGAWVAPAPAHRTAIVVGAGHNGLIAAAYMARAGVDVLVLERRPLVGGAAVTEEVFPGVKVSRASYVAGLLRPRIVKELGLEARGFKYLPRETSSFTPCDPEGPDAGKYLRFASDAATTYESIAQFSRRDADRFAEYESHISRCRDILPPLIDSPLPDVTRLVGGDTAMRRRLKVARDLYRLAGDLWPHRASFSPFVQLLTQPATRILDSWFESDILKATLATDACIGNGASVDEPGTGYALLHLVMGETIGRPGVWSYLEGGMGALSNAVRDAAVEAGAEICTDAEVVDILVTDDKRGVRGVRLHDGTEITADAVLSNATPYHTFLELVEDGGALPSEADAALRSQDYSGGAMKINCVTSALPELACWPTDGAIGPPHLGTVHFEDDVNQLRVAAAEARKGLPAERPMIEMAIPTSVDRTLAPEGRHIVQFFVQYTPYHLRDGRSWADVKHWYADRVFAHVDRYCPGFSHTVIDRDVLSPLDLERIFGLHEGNIYHGAHRIDQIAFWRPAAGFASHRTPLRNLYLCGAGCHPGGGVMGASGRNCSTVVLEDLELGPS